MRLKLTANDRARFWAKVGVRAESECWEWRKAKIGGYGAFWFGGKRKNGGKTERAHRIAFALANGGEIPDGLQVNHTCHNKLCCNPRHLYAGTHQDNMDDRTRAARQAMGEGHSQAKLTDEDVLRIRAMHSEGRRQSDIAAVYGVHRTTIYRIRRRENWKHI